MSQDRKKTKCDIGAAINFALDTSDISEEEIIEELRSNGIDIDIAIPKIMTNVNRKVFQKSWTDTAFENKAKMSSIANDIAEKFSSGKEEILERIRGAISSGQIQLQHRDYQDLTDEDLLGLLEDLEFLRKSDESKRKG